MKELIVRYCIEEFFGRMDGHVNGVVYDRLAELLGHHTPVLIKKLEDSVT